jgi:hypothetical protein
MIRVMGDCALVGSICSAICEIPPHAPVGSRRRSGHEVQVEDTWWSRDLPVLDAAVRLFEDEDFVYVGDLAGETGFDPEDVFRALAAMQGVYTGRLQGMGDLDRRWITEVAPAARRAVGQWPTPENVVARLAEAFSTAAEDEPDPERRGKLRALGSFLADTGKDFAAEVVAKVIAHQTGAA